MTAQLLKSFLLFFVYTLVQLAATISQAATMTGTLDSVVDGDTITVLDRSKVVEIHLYGIEAPERTQAFGQNSRNFIGGKTSRGEIRIEPISKDQEGKIVALVFVNNANLNEQMVDQGFVWVSRQTCKESFCANWLKLEAAAKTARKGLWAEENPTPPWEFRQRQLSAKDIKNIDPTVSKNIEPTAPQPTKTKLAPNIPAAYHGDTLRHVFHSAGCKEFNCPTCTVNFHTISEAMDAGYRPHLDCLTR